MQFENMLPWQYHSMANTWLNNLIFLEFVSPLKMHVFEMGNLFYTWYTVDNNVLGIRHFRLFGFNLFMF